MRGLRLDPAATRLVVARDTAIDVFDRNKLAGPRGAGATASSARSSEARLLTLKGHRRPVDCLDVDGNRVLSGARQEMKLNWIGIQLCSRS